MRIIALSGPVGVGKDSLAELIGKFVIDVNSLMAMKLPIAYQLKKELEKEIRNKYNLDSFSEKRDDKKVFRDDLINYAELKRKQNKKYWINKWFVNAKLAIDRCDVEPIFVITDLRHALDDCGNDLQVLKDNNAYTIYIERYSDSFFTNKSVFPYRESENKNDKSLKTNSDFVYRWVDGIPEQSFIESRDTPLLIENLKKYLGIYERK
jgi:hypothetical protein